MEHRAPLPHLLANGHKAYLLLYLADNSVHPQHRGGWHDRLNHYVFCFHDETFERLAESFTTERYLGSPRAVLSKLIGRLLT